MFVFRLFVKIVVIQLRGFYVDLEPVICNKGRLTRRWFQVMTSLLTPTNRMNIGRVKIKPVVIQRWPPVKMDLQFEVFGSIDCCHTTQCLITGVDHFQFFPDFEEQLRRLRVKRKKISFYNVMY